MEELLKTRWLYIGIAGVLGLMVLRYRNQDARIQTDNASYQQLINDAVAKAIAAERAAVERAAAEKALFDKVEEYRYS